MRALSTLVADLVGQDLPIRFEAYDGSSLGPANAPATVRVRSPDALRRIVTAPGELGLGRAYVSGDIDLDGDIFAILDLRDRLSALRPRPAWLLELARHLGSSGLRRPAPPPEEARLSGRLHSKARDAAAIAHHYDVGNEFYRIVLGPSLTYSCAVFRYPADSLEQAQANKYELICRKLGLREGMRLLDVGCGWGGMVQHAVKRHGARAVGVTLSKEQATLAAKAVAEAGLADRVEIRLQDYREIDDGPYDAISSIGMFEHVGRSRLVEYFGRLYNLLAPGARLLNHGISRPADSRRQLSRSGFVNRYVFPDGQLHEVGNVVSLIQGAGFEVRHVESLREHYARTLRAWVSNLEADWYRAVSLVGPARARIWRLYMAGSAINFEAGRTQIHQVLAVKPVGGSSGMPWRPQWEPLT